MKRWMRLFVIADAAFLALLFVAFVARAPLLRATVGAAGRAAGYRVSYGGLEGRLGHLTIVRPDVASAAGEPVFTAQRIDVAYDLRHAFRGPRLYGISSVEIDRPKLTVVHHRDGSYNIVLPKSSGGPSKPPLVPQMRLIVKDGSAGLIDDTRLYRHSRRLALANVQLHADLDPRRRSTFEGGFAVLEEGGKYPVTARGTIDETRGYELSRLRAPTLAIAPLIDYALNSTSLHVAGGVLNGLDARVYGLPDRSGAMRRHVSVVAHLDHFQPYLNGLAKPLRDGRGSLRAYDDGLAIPKVDGSIAGVPVRIAGAIYDLAQPVLRLGIVGRGDLRRLVTLNDAAKQLPLSGAVAFTLFVEGSAAQPTTLAAFRSPGIAYGRIPIDAPSGLVALHGQDTSILRSALVYDGIAAGARGNLHVEKKHTGVDVFAEAAVPAERIPYAAGLLGPMRVRASALVAGVDATVATTGVVAGDTPDERLRGTFAVDGRGVGTIGPLSLEGAGGHELYVRVALDRPGGGGGAAFIATRGLHVSTRGAQPVLPGFALAPLPPVDGTLDSDLAVAFENRRFTAGGDFHASGAHAFGYPIDDLTARARVTDGERVALEGRYRGALAPFGAAMGGKPALRGRADVPFTVVAAGTTSVLAQIHDARFTDAAVGGVSLDGLAATVGLRGRAVDVYGADVRLGGNDVVAQGSFGDGGTLSVSAAGVALAPLRALGLPVGGGTVTAVAAIGGTAAAPSLEGGVAADDVTLAGAKYADLPVSVNGGLHVAGDRLSVHDALLLAGPAVGSVDGTLSGLRASPAAARYTFAAHVREVDVATLARVADAPLRYPAGTLDADVRVEGSGSRPSLAGDVAIPEGSLNGLRFRDAAVAFAGTPADLRARGGQVTVGSSTIGFDAAFSPRARSVSLRAPKLELSDFNDYFDRGDTLGGSGSASVSVRNTENSLASGGRIRLAHTRFRRFELGATRADWSTHGRDVRADVALGSTAGRLSADGDIVLAATQPLRDPATRTAVVLAVRAAGVDLSTWLPAAGLQAPVAGFVDADARIRGSYPRLAVTAKAALVRGVVRGVPIRTATIAATASGGRATIARAALAIDNLTASAGGSAGLRPADPFDLTATASTPDVGALAHTLTGKTYPASGALQTVLHLTGTLRRPHATDVVDGQALRYERFTLPRAHAEVALSPTRATLQRAELDLRDGRILASGFAPLQSKPAFALGPRTAPLGLDLVAERIDLGQFADLLPKGTQATGVLDGRVSLAGSLANPGLDGNLALSGGSFVGPQERAKISNAAAQLTFRRRSATLHDASATVGGGTLALSGRGSLRDLTDPARSAAYSLQAVSDGAVFNLPQYFRGRVDGTVTLARARGATPVARGALTFTSTRIPTSALLQSNASGATPKTPPFPVALDLGIDVANDVRVQGGVVDIGAQGQLQVGGTLAQPTVSGELDSTGGTISFYRTFRLQYPSTLDFDPSNGITPNVDALASTTIDNPPTDVTLHVTGPSTQLNVALQSNPNYSREQILGLLVGAQALGAVSGVTTAGGGPQQNPFQALAEGQLGTLLTQNILEPFSSQLGSAVGLNSLALNYTPGGGASIGAQKKIFKNVNAVFAQSFNYPPRESIGLLASPNDATAIQLTFFSQPSSNRFNTFEGAQSLQSTNNAVTAVQPANGTSGFAFSFQRKFP